MSTMADTTSTDESTDDNPMWLDPLEAAVKALENEAVDALRTPENAMVTFADAATWTAEVLIARAHDELDTAHHFRQLADEAAERVKLDGPLGDVLADLALSHLRAFMAHYDDLTPVQQQATRDALGAAMRTLADAGALRPFATPVRAAA